MRLLSRHLAIASLIAAGALSFDLPGAGAKEAAGRETIATEADATGRTLVTVPFKGPAQVEDLLRHGIEIVAFTKYGIDVLADARQVDYLMSRNYAVTVAPRPQRTAAALDENLGQYTTYAELESTLAAWDTTAAYADRFDVFSIGSSIEGRTIRAFKISDNVTVDEDEPEVLYIANHHAREIMTVEMVMMFADTLLRGYGNDAAVTGHVDNREIYFVPMMNPDGHVYVEQNHDGGSNGWWRKNRRLNENFSFGVDLNRNWGYQWGYDDIGSNPLMNSPTYRGTGPFSEPETQAVRDFVNQREIVMWLSYHSYGELLLYPWGYDHLDTPDHDVFTALGDTLTASNGYAPGKGISLYPVNGDSDDWGYGVKDVFAFTPEINAGSQGGFGPDESWIQPTFDLLLEMNLLVLALADNPYRVVGPYTPAQYAITEPWGPGAVHRLSWSGNDPADPNPVVGYDVEACASPHRVTDDGTLTTLWDIAGFTVAPGYAGDGYDSGMGNNLDHSLAATQSLAVVPGDTLSFWITWDIETDWDYGYVEVSSNGGGTWTSIPGNITTDTDPNGNNQGHGITGQSGGWVAAAFPLDAWAGQDILYRFRYVTDGYLINDGFTIDDVAPVPSCASVETIASAIPDTTLDVQPDSATTYRYRVRAFDAEGQTSRWSNTRDYEVLTLTAAAAARRFSTALGRNYPNPFNPSTRIPFVVGGAGSGGSAGSGAGASGDGGGSPAGAGQAVTLRIYAVTGARVATLVDDRRAPGTYQAIWNGTNDAGQTMASGIYFAQLTVASQAPVTRKLVLLK